MPFPLEGIKDGARFGAMDAAKRWNVREMEPYFPLWSSISVTRGYLGVIAVEHDRTSRKVRRIVKGTSGRALL